MIQTKHTPGPWVFSTNTNDTQEKPFEEACIEGADNEIIGFFKNIPNARLIAAAPDLLEQLQLLVRWAEDQGEDCAFAKAAIAKATGAV